MSERPETAERRKRQTKKCPASVRTAPWRQQTGGHVNRSACSAMISVTGQSPNTPPAALPDPSGLLWLHHIISVSPLSTGAHRSRRSPMTRSSTPVTATQESSGRKSSAFTPASFAHRTSSVRSPAYQVRAGSSPYFPEDTGPPRPRASGQNDIRT